jgi:hypothetical protein
MSYEQEHEARLKIQNSRSGLRNIPEETKGEPVKQSSY